MGFNCGIVGLPNVGKSTLFNAITNLNIEAQNYPFCTIEPNVGRVPVPDPRLQQLAEIVKPERIVPTSIDFVDIAGLVKGASQGEGLGNQFLGHIREVDAIAHVLRCFENSDIIHVNGRVDPLHDAEITNTELLLADLDSVERGLSKALKNAKTGAKPAMLEKEFIEKLKQHLDNGHPARTFTVAEDYKILFDSLHLLTAKPMMYIANVNESGFENNPLLDKVTALAQAENAVVVPICASIEAEISKLDEADKQDFLQDLGLAEPGLNRVIRAGYKLLKLETYFTAGVKEVRAWTIPVGTSAPKAAAVIHTDFEKGFIRAEVIAFNDFITYKGEAGAKEAGKWRLEGKEYIVQEGDIMHFRFNV